MDDANDITKQDMIARVDEVDDTGSATSDVPGEELSDALAAGEPVKEIPVSISPEVIHLLSEQMYTSPLKAIEELVANAYDADANVCRIALFLREKGTGKEIETPDDKTSVGDSTEGEGEIDVVEEGDSDEHAIGNIAEAGQGRSAPGSKGVEGLIAVFDDGHGMTVEGLADLWSVGASPKRAGKPTARHGRMPIGKFGIGKLATYAVANRITYVTSGADGVHHVVCDFGRFEGKPPGSPAEMLQVTRIDDLQSALARPDMLAVLERLGIEIGDLSTKKDSNWTLCLLDHLKPAAADLQVGRLSWVLRTAMPLQLEFSVFLDNEEQKSSKEEADVVVSFEADELEPRRIASLNKKHGMKLVARDGGLFEAIHFPSGIKGKTIVTAGSLRGKSERYTRSYGFFIRVRGRLINLEDPLFHNSPHSFTTFNRFRADLDIDDLHEILTAPREGVHVGLKRELAVAITHEIALQARDRFEKADQEENDPKLTPEHTRVYVAERLVERPMADALTIHGSDAGGDVDNTWMYVEDVAPEKLRDVVTQLYTERTRYDFARSSLGETEPLTRFDPNSSSFLVNSDHELVRAFDDDPRARELLDLVAAAEVMLEVYMVESDLPGFEIGEILSRRDLLLRSLATDRVFSRPTIAKMLRKHSDDAIQLELALIAAARAMGFQVKHVAGSKQPDGIARFLDTTGKETKITLEAKSSKGTPSLSAIDFAGLQEHKTTEDAAGCLLVAPSYPAKLDDGSSTANRARNLEISCWTVEQLALVVEKGEDLEITAAQIAHIVANKFAPIDVEAAIAEILANSRDMGALYRGVMDQLGRMFAGQSPVGAPKRVTSIAALLAEKPEFAGISEDDVKLAAAHLASQSKGGLSLAKRGDVLMFHTDFEEVERRVSHLTKNIGKPRSLGTFKN